MLANPVAWVGGEVGGGGALHMLCKVSLLPLLVSTFACNFFKLKRASRSLAKTGFRFVVCLMFFSGHFLGVVFRVPRELFGVFLEAFGCLGASFGRLLVNFRSFRSSF